MKEFGPRGCASKILLCRSATVIEQTSPIFRFNCPLKILIVLEDGFKFCIKQTSKIKGNSLAHFYIVRTQYSSQFFFHLSFTHSLMHFLLSPFYQDLVSCLFNTSMVIVNDSLDLMIPQSKFDPKELQLPLIGNVPRYLQK